MEELNDSPFDFPELGILSEEERQLLEDAANNRPTQADLDQIDPERVELIQLRAQERRRQLFGKD